MNISNFSISSSSSDGTISEISSDETLDATDAKTQSLVHKIFLAIGNAFAYIRDTLYSVWNSLFGKRETIIDQVFPEVTETDSTPFPFLILPQVKKSLEEIFGVEDVVNKIPVHNEDLKYVTEIKDLPYPVMIAQNSQGTPLIAIKLRVVDREEYVEISMEGRTVEPKSLKEDVHGFVLMPKYVKIQNQLLWGIGSKLEKHEPMFLSANISGQLTCCETGDVPNPVKKLIPDFQKLFHGDGIATDVNGNRWKLDL